MLLKIFLLSLFFFISSTGLYAQLDNNKVEKTDAFSFQPENESNEKNIIPFSQYTPKLQGETKTLFGTIIDISANFPKYSIINKTKNSSMINHNNSDKDLLVKKYWNGNDVSVVKLNTKLELGKLETNTKRIRIECRDHSYVDGDRVRLYVNEKVVRRSITLQAGYYAVDIELNEGFNRIDIEALNQGSSGPNTAEFKVFDEEGNMLASKEWNILTGYVATLIVMKN